MKRIILCLCLSIFIRTEAQQINPVPDYVFSNKMSVGRNAVTDTAAYFSIGPRYGAIRGMMPPMVTDTASMSATKRNGLLIFSIQKNKYLYWDSVGSKWAEMAGTAGSAITGSGVAGYMPEFTTSTNLDTTRLYHSAGRFAIGSTTTTNGVFNVYGGQAYFDTSLKVGTQTLFADEGKNEVYVNTTGDSGTYALQVNGTVFTNSSLYLSGISKWELLANASKQLELINWNYSYRAAIFDTSRNIAFGNLTTADGGDAALYINGKGKEVYVNSLIDAGAYALQVSGGIYNTNDALLSQISGSVLIGRASALIGEKFSTTGYAIIGTSSQGVFGDGGGGNVVVGSYTNSPLEFRTNNIERMRIKSDGEVLIGTTTDAGAYALQVAGAQYVTGSGVFDPTATGSNYLYVGTTSVRSISGIAPGAVQVVGNAGNTGGITIAGQLANNSFGEHLQFIKSRGTSNVIVQNGDRLGTIMWAGADGTNYLRAASIQATIDGTPGTNDMPTRLEFSVTSDGTSVPTYRMALNNAGELIIQDNPTDAGNYKLQVDGAIYNTSTITTGAPTGGSIKPWRLGEAATVSPTSPNRTIRVEIDGTVYYIHAKTTND